MFTGIIEELGTVKSVTRSKDSSLLSISGSVIFDDLKLGDSVAVNGVCLTVAALTKHTFSADVMHETLDRSSLGALKQGSKVNLERALSASGRLGGHIVSGHIDGIGAITAVQADGNAVWYTIAASKDILRYVVVKGSIAIDGISLTVARLGASDLSVSIIPHTAQETILSLKRAGDTVNVENDVIGKYVERLLSLPAVSQSKSDPQKAGVTATSTITNEFLIKNGF